MHRLVPSDTDSVQRDAEDRRNDAQGCSLDMMTPAQAYAYAVKTGQDVNRTLHFTIERKQPLRAVHCQQQPAPFQASNAGSEHGGMYARRLYASAIGARSLTNLASNTAMSTQLLDTPTGGSAVSASNGRHASIPNPSRNASRAPFNADPLSVRKFSAADFYHSSLPRNDFRPIRTSGSGIMPQAGALTSAAKGTPHSAPPASAPSFLAKYSQSQASHSQTEMSQSPLGSERSATPCSPLEVPPPGHPRSRPSSQDFLARDLSLSYQVPTPSSSTGSLAKTSASPSPSEDLEVVCPRVSDGRGRSSSKHRHDIQKVSGELVIGKKDFFMYCRIYLNNSLGVGVLVSPLFSSQHSKFDPPSFLWETPLPSHSWILLCHCLSYVA